MKQFTQLFEAPIDVIGFHGDWRPEAKPRGYDKPSIGILTSQAGVEKIRQKWANVNETFDMYFVRSAKGYKHFEVGEVKPEWVKENLGIDIPIHPDKITLIFTSNRGAERVPMTPWTLAHRFGHAASAGRWRNQAFGKTSFHPVDVFNREMDKAFSQIYRIAYGSEVVGRQPSYGYSQYQPKPNQDKVFLALANSLGTMKSARDRNLRNYYEFSYELLAQYMISGKCVLNHDLAKVIPSRGYAWGKPQGPWKRNLTPEQQDTIDSIIDNLQNAAEEYATNTIGSAVGKVYVM